MSDDTIALAAAHRKAARQQDIHPRAPYRGTGFARGGEEIPHPYCGGPPESWSPPPGAEYTRAEVDGDTERVYHLRQHSTPAE